MNSPAVLGLGMSSIGIIILTDFTLQIHLCIKFTQNSRQITEFIEDLSCTTLRFHRIFTWEKNQRRCRNPFTFFYNLKVDRWHQATLFLKLFLWYLKVLQNRFLHIFTIFDQKSQILVIFYEKLCLCTNLRFSLR